MSTEGEQIAVAAEDGTEKAKDCGTSESGDCAKSDTANTEAIVAAAQVNGISESGDAEAEDVKTEAEAEKQPETALEQPADTEPESESLPETAAAEEQKPEVNSVDPPQIVVDTVPDRDPESPTEPEATTQSDTKADEASEGKKEEPKSTEVNDDSKKTEDAKKTVNSTETETVNDTDTGEKDKAADTAESETVGEEASKETDTSGNPDFNGKYRQVESENIEAFMQAVGMPWLMRKLATKISPTTEIRQEGDKFVIKIVTGFMTKESKFTVGEDYEDNGFGWKKEPTKVTTKWDSNLLVMIAEPKNEKSKSKPVKIVRELDGDRMTMNFEVGDVLSKRVFERKK